MIEGINIYAVIVSTVVAMALGFFWYSPTGLGNRWMKEVGIKPEDIDSKDSQRGIWISLAGAFIQAWMLAFLIAKAEVGDVLGGLLIGLGIGIGFIATTLFGNDVYEKKTWQLSLINSSYRVLYLAIAGAIFGAWPD